MSARLVVGVLVVLGAGVGLALALGGKKTPVTAPASEQYKGFTVTRALDKKAWRWTVLMGTTPLASALSVLEEEARITGRNWVDLLTTHRELEEITPAEPPPGIEPDAPLSSFEGEPEDMLRTHAFQPLNIMMASDYYIEISTSKTGVDGDHFRWAIYRAVDESVDSSGYVTIDHGWSATPADARMDAYNWMAADLYTRGMFPWRELL